MQRQNWQWREFLDASGILSLLTKTGLRSPLALMSRVARHPSTLQREIDVWADYHRFKRDHAFLSTRLPEGDSSKKVLVIGLTNFVAQVKVESLLAKALQCRGLTPVILTQSWRQQALRYYRVFGFDQFVFLDHYAEEVPRQAANAIDELLDGGGAVEEIKAFRYQDVAVGQQALATFLRGTRLGKVDTGHPRLRAYLRRLLREGVQAVRAAEAMLDAVQPQIALANDALYIGVGGVFEKTLQRGVPVVQWLGSQRDDAFVLKRFGWTSRRQHPSSLSPSTWDRAREMSWTPKHEQQLMQDFEERYALGRWTSYYNRPYGPLKSKVQLQDELELNPSKKTAVIFSHILWDSTLFWGEDLFADYEDWLVETVRAACQNPAVNWVIKLHPANVWKLRRERADPEPQERIVLRTKLGKLPGHIALLDADAPVNTFSLFQLADYCLTVRGTIGIEMAAFGIPVFTAGTGRYSGYGFTIDSDSREQYLARLHRIQESPRLSGAQLELAKKYAHTVFIMRPWRFQSFRLIYKSLRESGHPLDHNVVVQPRSWDELLSAPDLERFAAWVMGSDQADFLHWPEEEHSVRRDQCVALPA